MGRHFLLQGIFLTQDQTWVSYTEGRFFTVWTTREAPSILKSPQLLIFWNSKLCPGVSQNLTTNNYLNKECFFTYIVQLLSVLWVLLANLFCTRKQQASASNGPDVESSTWRAHCPGSLLTGSLSKACCWAGLFPGHFPLDFYLKSSFSSLTSWLKCHLLRQKSSFIALYKKYFHAQHH